MLKPLWPFVRGVDWFSEQWGRFASYALLLSCLISAGNASLRYAVNQSSNAWLEIQWYLFGAAVLLSAPFVLKINEHVRVDVLYGRWPARGRAWIDLLGLVFFLMPFAAILLYLSWPFFLDAFRHHEMSSNAGGLIRWPIKLAMPMGAALLGLQGLSEIIKRIGFLRGEYNMDTHYERPLQ